MLRVVVDDDVYCYIRWRLKLEGESVFSVLSTVIPPSVHIITLGSLHGAEDSSGMRS